MQLASLQKLVGNPRTEVNVAGGNLLQLAQGVMEY